jgi:hypothetical protein
MSRGETEREGIADAISQRVASGKTRAGTAAIVLGSLGAVATVLFAVFWPQHRAPEATTNLASMAPTYGEQFGANAEPLAVPLSPAVPPIVPTDSALAARVSELRRIVDDPDATTKGKRAAVLELMGLAHDRAPELRNAKLSPARISMSHSGAVLDLREVDFQGADLAWGMFTKADLEHANFSTARLLHASLKETNLRSARFDGADCSGANFQDANVSGANFTAANLTRANFRSVDLSGALGLTTEQLGSACWDESTKLPAGMKPSFADCGQLP